MRYVLFSLVLPTLFAVTGLKNEPPGRGSEVYYLPFGSTTIVPVGPSSMDRMHNMSSLWKGKLSELERLLRCGSQRAEIDRNHIRLIIVRQGGVQFMADSKGVVWSSSGESKALSDSDFETLKLWIYLQVPHPDIPDTLKRNSPPSMIP